MNLQRYLFLFLRFSWLIILLVAIAIASAWAWLNTQKPVYAARAVLEVVTDQAQVLDSIKDVKDTRITGLDAVNTVVQSLTSNTIMLAVAESTGVAAEWAKDAPGGKVSPEMESALAGYIRNKVTASLRRGTRLIDVIAEDSTPEKARDLAAKIVEEFLALQTQDRTDVSKDANSFLVQEATKLKNKLEDSENKLTKYRLENNAVSLIDRQNIIVERLTALNAQVTDANTKRASIETDLSTLKKVDPNDVDAMLRLPSVAALPDVAALRSAVITKEGEFSALKERYLELHPKYIAALTELNDFRNKLKTAVVSAGETLRQQYQNFAETEEKLKDMLKEQEKKALELDRVSIPYNTLQREAQSDRALYEAVLTRLKETNVTQGLTKNPYKLAEAPLVNLVPVRPNWTKTLTMAGLGAIALGIGLILLIDRLDASIRTVDEAEQEFGLPVLSAVPDGKGDPSTPGGTVTTDEPDSPQAEALRNLRASISLLGEASQNRLLLVTSAIPGEGKSFTSSNLGASFATQGLKTLVIDADLRRPALSAAFLETEYRKGTTYRGLTDVLSGQAEVNETIQHTAVDNLSLMPSGRRAPNPSELLANFNFPPFFEALLAKYDRVIVDTAPINAVSDAMSIAPYVQAVCLVLRFGKTPRRAVKRAIILLQKTNARIAGIVMNRMPKRKGASYYYYYYGDPYAEDNVYGNEGKKRKKRSQSKPEAI